MGATENKDLFALYVAVRFDSGFVVFTDFIYWSFRLNGDLRIELYVMFCAL